VSQREIRPFEMYLFLAVAYWICTYSMSRFSRWLEVRMSPEKAPSKRAALREAATATGLSHGQTTLYVILPQAIRNMIPSLVTQFIVLFKDTSLASIIGMMDLTKAAQTVSQREIRPFEMYLFLAVAYWICTYSMSRLSRWLEVRMSPEKAPSKRAALREAARAAAD
ncbi:MAG TPA: ABC transporter permease subunit, partial [Candidatus Methylomirabilis sp.]